MALVAPLSQADSKAVIDAKVEEAIQKLRKESPAASSLIDKASGVLVFPEVVKIAELPCSVIEMK